jgi:transposase
LPTNVHGAEYQKVETWLRLHIEAFEHFQGAAMIVVPDNLKSAVIRAAFTPSEPTTLNRSYRELARHYKFKIAPTPPRSPEKKGKVESGVKYVKNNFFAARPDERDANVLGRELERLQLAPKFWNHNLSQVGLCDPSAVRQT